MQVQSQILRIQETDMSSLLDVARKAGVSKTLVSRAMNGQPGVSEASRQKIFQAMQELNYKPNALARSLVMKKTMTIGVVMDTLCEPFFFPLIEGIEHAAENTGYDVVFASGRNSVRHKENAVHYFMEGRADGLILYGSKLEDEHMIRFLAQGNFPFVVVENTFPALQINNIALDSDFGASVAIEHLLACGCQTIAYVGGDMQYRASIDRQNGFIQTMQRHGFIVDSSMIVPSDFTVSGGYEALKQFLSQSNGKKIPDAFYCGSDNTAYGAIMALEEAGIHVPEQAMVIGFDDDLPPRGYRYEQLTTLAQPLYAMGRKAFEILQHTIDQPSSKIEKIVFYPELKVRNTTRQISTQG